MNTLRYVDHSELYELAKRSQRVSRVCGCSQKALVGWESPLISLPEGQLLDIGTLMYDDEDAMTLNEYHPQGTHYWSLEAPIAPRYYPYNLCKVSECSVCGRYFLRYTESGAYHIEQRIRSLDPGLMINAPLPPAALSASANA